MVTERSASDEEILDAIAKAEEEMKRCGIVAVGDICNNATTLAQKEKGNLHYYNFIEASGWLPAIADARFERALNLYNEFQLYRIPISSPLRHLSTVRLAIRQKTNMSAFSVAIALSAMPRKNGQSQISAIPRPPRSHALNATKRRRATT